LRIDQFLQKIGVVKRRSLAKSLCENGAVRVNDKVVKPAHTISPGDAVIVRFRSKRVTYQVLAVPAGNVKKEQREDYIRITREEHFHEDD
jgi:ribosomal 50S subunit-recycling heat shock protein